MTRAEIVEKLARAGTVEEMVQNVAHSPLTADLRDLVQMVYLALLEYDEAKLQDLWEHRQMRFFIARIILNQYRSRKSPFHRLVRGFRVRSDELSGRDWADEADG